MKTVGSIVKEARVRRKITLEQAESATKIRRKFLQAIESDDFSAMPSVSYAKGFIKNYSEFLGLDSSTVMAFFRRQSKEVVKSSLLPKGVAEPLNTPIIQLTPRRFMAVCIFVLVGLFLLYFGLQYRRIQTPPNLSLQSPKNNSVTTEKRVDILGTTDPDATVTINGVNVQVHEDGKFFDQVALDTRLTTITIVAVSRYGKSTTITKNIEYLGQ
jgi:cytoskeletal protein RodZ